MSTDRWQVMPDLSDDEYAALKADIAEHGCRVPVVVDADTGETIDGHHRRRAIEELRGEGVIVAYNRQAFRFGDDDERLGFVVAANLFRRHLTRSQRAELVAKLRSQGWSLRRIGEVVGVDHKTVRADLTEIGEDSPISEPERVGRKGGGSYPARRPKPPPSIVVGSDRDEARARAALSSLGEDAPGGLRSLARTEERARIANMERLRGAEVPPVIEGAAYELRLGDFREVLADVEEGSVDAIVTDPPYNEAGWHLYEDLGAFGLRVLKPGRLAAVYCGHLHLDGEMQLLSKGGLTYMWHGANWLPGRHAKIRVRLVFGSHRSVLLYSKGAYEPRHWIYDTTSAEGRGGPDERPLHPWQQAVEPIRHWVRSVSKPGELICDPFIGSGTTAIACLLEGRRFVGADIDPGCVETARRRIEELLGGSESEGA
jgi:hypothetical protein